VPTIVPKTIKPTAAKTRDTKNSLGLIPKPKLPVVFDEDVVAAELTNEEKLQQENEALENKQQKENTLNKSIDELKEHISQITFTVERFKHNKIHFKFYTGFDSYDIFCAVLDFLKPEVYSLNYWGSKISTVVDSTKKRGRARTLNVDEEFFLVLIRLRCAFPVEDLGVRFNISSSSISRILITWYDFLHIQFRALPNWSSKKIVVETMPNCFKELYPNTRVIIDCTEIFTEMPTSYRSQSATFSNYKHHNTAKALIGIAT
jgi:hypothetical protein